MSQQVKMSSTIEDQQIGNLSLEGRKIILKATVIFNIIYLIIDEIRKIESSFLSKIYIFRLYNHSKNRGKKIIPVLRQTINSKCSAVRFTKLYLCYQLHARKNNGLVARQNFLFLFIYLFFNWREKSQL